MTRSVHSGGTVARSACSHPPAGHYDSQDSRQMCLDMARAGYGWEDIMVKASVSRSLARWIVLGIDA